MTSDKKHKIHTLKRIVNYLLSIALSIVFLYLAFNGVEFGKVMQLVSKSSLYWLIIFVAVLFLSHFIRAVRWKIILRSVKPGASLLNLFGSLMVGYGVNCVVPRFGEVSRAILLGRWENLSRSAMFGTVIVERVIDVIFLAFAVLLSAAVWSESLYLKFPWLKSTLILTFILLALVVLSLFFVIYFREKFYRIFVKAAAKFSEKLSHKLDHIFEMLIEGFASLKGTKNVILVIFMSAVLMMIYAFSSYLGFYILGMEQIQPISYKMGWVLMSISAIGIVIPTPGGTGSYHALAKSTLVLLFGFAEDISLAYAFLTHIVSYFLFIFSALFFFFLINKKQHVNLFSVVDTEVDEL